jgi:2-amino-4-hydroxy-6-hydroxymethyldihydropteridine diphosphokinase
MYLIALGANLPSAAGEPGAALERALTEMGASGLEVTARSGWYRTPAWPPGSGPDYLNGAVAVESAHPPAEVLGVLHAVEARLGRTRHRRWEPRPCDLDLLASGSAVLPDAATVRAWMELAPDRQAAEAPGEPVVPHPRLHERGFVLAPLAEIAPDWVHPLLGLSVREMLAALPPAALEGIVRIEER